jgi:hypothetical protein
VEQVVTLSVEVDALGCHVSGHEHPQIGTAAFELFDDFLLGLVSQPTVEHLHGIFAQLQPLGEFFLQIQQGLTTFSEDYGTHRRTTLDADVFEFSNQAGKFGIRHVERFGVQLAQLMQCRTFSFGFRAGIFADPLQPGVDGFLQGTG